MTPPASTFGLGTEFDAFLFAPTGAERNGMPLSVVSLLARMDLDPWQEAASLAALPAETAARKLAAWLEALPESIPKQADTSTTAARLIALLPRRPAAVTRSSAAAVGAVLATPPRALVSTILFAIYMILMVGAQIAFLRREPPALADTVHAPASPTVPSETPPTNEH
jgi:hypothetical protein